ncbi:MAG TPA: hypothetical protein QF753_07160 [Victivallales bacterium]|nr:hypothetical protein [Victivallales bacterium]
MNEFKIVGEIRHYMLMIAFLISFSSIALCAIRNRNDIEKILMHLVFTAVVIVMMALYPNIITSSVDTMGQTTTSISEQIDKGINEWSKSRVDGDDSWYNIKEQIISALYKTSIFLSSLLRSFMIFMQRNLMYALIALSPVLMAFLLIKETSDVGVKFCMITLATIFWTIGFNLSDMMLFSGWNAIVQKIIEAPGQMTALGGTGVAAAAIKTAALTANIKILAAGTAITIGLYFVVGILVFNIIGVVLIFSLFLGGNPISSALSSVTAASTMTSAGSDLMKGSITPNSNIGGATPLSNLLSSTGISPTASKSAKGLGNIASSLGVKAGLIKPKNSYFSPMGINTK